MIPLRTVQLSENLAAPTHHGLIFDAADLVKERRDRLVGHRLDPIDAKERGFAADRLNLLHEPLKELRGLWILGQDPRGPSEPDRPHALELSPDSYAVPCRGRRQGGEERQPPHITDGNPCYLIGQALHRLFWGSLAASHDRPKQQAGNARRSHQNGLLESVLPEQYQAQQANRGCRNVIDRSLAKHK